MIMSEEKLYVGIDLGTTNTLAGWMHKGKPELVKFPVSKKILPSVIYVDEAGKLFVGQGAKQMMGADPQNGVSSAKTFIGKFDDNKGHYGKNKWQCHGRLFDPTEVATEVLKVVRENIIRRTKMPDDVQIDAIITVPAYFNTAQKEETKKAGENAGFNVIRILPEPTAAAIAAVSENLEDDRILVVDLGGGTFDLSLLAISREDNEYSVKALAGNECLGGDDFDRVICEYLLECLQKQTGFDLSSLEKSNLDTSAYYFALGRLKSEAEKAKIELTESKEYNVELPDLFIVGEKSYKLSVIITRDEFNDLCSEIYEVIFDKIKEFRDHNAAEFKLVTRIILAGGTCNIPYIVENIQKMFDFPVDSQLDIDTLVVKGACLMAESYKDGIKNAPKLNDILSHSFGIEVIDENNDAWLSKIVKKDEHYPVTKSNVYTTHDDYQEEILIDVYEAASDCEDDERISVHNRYGSFTLTGIEYAKRGVPQIEVTFSFDENQQLTVTARDKKTGAQKTVKLERGSLEVSTKKVKPVDFVLLMDTSGSMVNDLSEAKDACKALIDDIIDVSVHRIGVVKFGYTGEILSYLTSDKEKLLSVIKGLFTQGNTNLVSGLKCALDCLTKSGNREKVVIVVTDGIPNSISQSIQTAKILKDEGIRILSVGIGCSANWDYLKQLSGDDVFTIKSISELKKTFKEVVGRVTKCR